MNERIKELEKQAWEFVDKTWNWANANNPSQATLFKTKFAELIVREYETLLPEICPWDGPKDSPMKGWHVQFVARKHFGVE
jgi:hypothetical protein